MAQCKAAFSTAATAVIATTPSDASIAPASPLVVLRRRQVEARTGLPRSALYRRIADNEFPKPIPLGPTGLAVGWIESEISAWISQCVAARDSAA